jgi:sporulation protein YtfJ
VDIHGLIKALLGELKDLVRTESVVGKPIQAGDTTVIPVSRVSLGFGGGGGNAPGRKEQPTEGSGIGGGASIEPVAFIVIHNGKAQLVNVQDKDGFGIGKVVDLIPELLETVKGFRGKRQDPKDTKDPKDPKDPGKDKKSD